MYLHLGEWKLLPLQGARLIALIPRVLPWARSFSPFRAYGRVGGYSIAAQTLRNQSSFLPLISAMDKFSLFTSSLHLSMIRWWWNHGIKNRILKSSTPCRRFCFLSPTRWISLLYVPTTKSSASCGRIMPQTLSISYYHFYQEFKN